MSHNKGAEALGVSHVGRTRSAFTIPCVPYDGRTRPGFGDQRRAPSVEKPARQFRPAAPLPEFPIFS